MADVIYPLVVARMSDEDVLDALRQQEKYVDEMLLALLDAVDKRQLPFPEALALRAEIQARAIPEPEPEPLVEEVVVEELPVLYSQTAILAFTIFFTPLFGGILLAMNVNRIKKSLTWQVVAISVALTMAVGLANWFIPQDNFMLILVPIAAGFILSELVWNRFIGKGVPYMHRKVLVPLIIALAITLPLAYYIQQHPEILDMQTVSNEK